MNLYIRLFLVIIKSLFAKKIAVTETSVLPFRVLPTDIDLNMHLNNGRYFSIMDLGRVALTVRCGLLAICFKRKWLPVLGSEMIRFIGEIKPLSKYELHTTCIGHDGKWFYIRQDFYQNEKRKARAYVRGVFLYGRKKVSPKEMIEELGEPYTYESLLVSDELKSVWDSTEHKLLGDV